MKITVNLKQLYELKRELWNSIKRHVDGRMFGTETIDVGQSFAEAIQRFQEANPIELWEEGQKKAERDAAKARSEKDEAEAAERVKFWFTCGLISNQHNLTTLRKIIADKMEGTITAFNIDVCMNRFRDEFQWKPVPAAEAAPVVEPPPPPILIDDPESPSGKSEQLPLGITLSSRFSKAQLRDYDARSRAERARVIREQNNVVASAAKAQPVLEVL